MSRHLHLDLVGGIAGDMTVAALVDAGVELDALRAALSGSGLPTVPISIEREWRGGMAGARFLVEAERDPPHRTWKEIRAMLGRARLPERARDLALAIFGRLADAEGAVHGCAPDEVHFHEVGAMDSIVDVVATAVGVDLLDATGFSCGAVPVCAGTVDAAHGAMPLPVPAAARLLTGFRLVEIPGAIETVTPTGAAILATLCGDSLERPRPETTLRAVGVGMGTAELPGRANVLRVLLGERAANAPGPTDAVVLEANIDDMDPRLFGPLYETLFGAGALDVWLTPVQMKKQRPGTVVSVLAPPDREDALCALLLRETTTLGVRAHAVRRAGLARRVEEVETPFGRVRVKVAVAGGEAVSASPEWDDCERLAREAGVPVKDVLAAAVAAAGAR